MNPWTELLRLLREFGADAALIASVERLANRYDAEVEALAGIAEDDTDAREAALVAVDEAHPPLSDDDLDDVLAGIVALADEDEASVALIRAAADGAAAVRAEQTARVESAEAEEAEREAERQRLLGDPAASGEGGDGAGDEGAGDEGAGEGGDEGAGDGAGADDAAGVPVTAGAGARRPNRAARRDLARSGRAAAAADVPVDRRNRIVLAADVPGFQPGAEVADMGVVNRALAARSNVFRRTASRRRPLAPGEVDNGTVDYFPVATLHADYPPERQLTDDPSHNTRAIAAALRGIRGGEEAMRAIVAAGGICAPPTPVYNVEVMGDARRPIRDALPGFQATRGSIMTIVPPILPNLAGSSIVWTMANDADPNNAGATGVPVGDRFATKPCLRVDCGNDTTSEIYAIPLCLEFGNVNARTFPEWTDAWGELAIVAQARLAEQRMHTAIMAGSTAVTQVDYRVDAVLDVLAVIDTLATGFRSRHRLADDYPFQTILPETLRATFRIAISRTLPGGSTMENLALSDAAIAAWFTARNVMPIWSPDVNVMGAQNAGAMVALPTTVAFPLFPAGTWLALDAGEIDLGVVRDSTLNSTNDFQVFSETFEGVHKLGVESVKVTVELCPSGARSGTIDPQFLCATFT